jgi:hypothetical protein
MSPLISKILQGFCLVLAVIILYINISDGFADSFSGRGVNVLLYVGKIIIAVGLVVASIILNIKISKNH